MMKEGVCLEDFFFPFRLVFGYVLFIEMCGMVSIKINAGMWKSSGNYLLKKRKGD